MRNQLIKILSVLCAAAVLFTALPAAFAESGEETVPETPAAEEILSAEEPAAEEPDSVEEPAAETSGTVEVPAAAEESVPAEETVPAEEPAAGEEAVCEEESAPAEDTDSAEEIPVAKKPAADKESAPAEESVSGGEPVEAEPVKLIVGNDLAGMVSAGGEYKIELKAVETGTAALTLVPEDGRAMNVRIEGRETEPARTETVDAGRTGFVYNLDVTAWCDYSMILTAEADAAFSLKTGCTAAEPAAESGSEEKMTEEAAEEPAEEEGEPAAEEQAAAETEEVPAEEPVEDQEISQVSEQEMLDAGYIRVMVIRQNGTGLYNARDEHAEAVGSLECGDIVWAKPAGEIWGEIYREEGEPLYFNLNNVALQLGEVGYDVPIRKVKLSSSLEGLTEIDEGSWIVMTAEISGFTEEEIVDVAWQYRPSGDAEFCEIEDAKDFTYIYPVSAENVHYEWRIVLTIKS